MSQCFVKVGQIIQKLKLGTRRYTNLDELLVFLQRIRDVRIKTSTQKIVIFTKTFHGSSQSLHATPG